MTAQSKKEAVNSVMAQYFLPGDPGAALLVRKEGHTIIERGYGLADLKTGAPVTAATNFRMASVSKQFTAMAILLLAAEQKINLTDPLEKFFPGLPFSLQAITVEQLLTHTSGIPDYESLIPEDRIAQLNDTDVLRLIQKKDSVYFVPGTAFRYSNTGYCLLALIVARVSGKSFPQYMQDKIFKPLKMAASLEYEKAADIPERAYGYHKKEATWHFADQSLTSATLGDGGVYTSLQDYRRWNEALLDHALLSKEWTDSLFTSHVQVKDGIGYGYGWFVGKEKDGSSCWFHSGESTGFHNIVYCNPRKKLLIVLFTNRDDDAIAPAFDRIAGIMGVEIASISRVSSLFHWLSGVYGD